jgi:hypothetical protein
VLHNKKCLVYLAHIKDKYETHYQNFQTKIPQLLPHDGGLSHNPQSCPIDEIQREHLRDSVMVGLRQSEVNLGCSYLGGEPAVDLWQSEVNLGCLYLGGGPASTLMPVKL